MGSPLQPAERFETTDAHSLAALVARDPEFPERRRRLVRVVAITVSTCGLILVAAGIARLCRAAPEVAAPPPITFASAAPAVPSAAMEPPVTPAPEPSPPPPATTGTLTLQKPALPGRVWVDGKKLGQAQTSLSCGKHKVKVGLWGRTHTVEVPCGGELKIAR